MKRLAVALMIGGAGMIACPFVAPVTLPELEAAAVFGFWAWVFLALAQSWNDRDWLRL